MSIINKIFKYPFLIRILNELLSDQDKLNLFYCGNIFNSKNKTMLKFYNQYKIKKRDQKCWWYNCLTNVEIDEIELFLPLPIFVTRLTFGPHFNQNVRSCIPDTVTHLTFGLSFNKDIKYSIPNSVTHLSFSYRFFRNIKGCIPNSVKYLKIDEYLYKQEKEHIPSSVICSFSENIFKYTPNQ